MTHEEKLAFLAQREEADRQPDHVPEPGMLHPNELIDYDVQSGRSKQESRTVNGVRAFTKVKGSGVITGYQVNVMINDATLTQKALGYDFDQFPPTWEGRRLAFECVARLIAMRDEANARNKSVILPPHVSHYGIDKFRAVIQGAGGPRRQMLYERKCFPRNAGDFCIYSTVEEADEASRRRTRELQAYEAAQTTVNGVQAVQWASVCDVLSERSRSRELRTYEASSVCEMSDRSRSPPTTTRPHAPPAAAAVAAASAAACSSTSPFASPSPAVNFDRFAVIANKKKELEDKFAAALAPLQQKIDEYTKARDALVTQHHAELAAFEDKAQQAHAALDWLGSQ